MIMRPGQQLLLPASGWFIWMSLVAALLLNMLLTTVFGSASLWLPDFLAVVLVFWNVNQTRRVNVGAAFLFGLLMDVHSSSLLGEHALSYSLLSYFAVSMHRRLRWFSLDGQAVQLVPLFLAAHATQWLVRWLVGNGFPGWAVLGSPALEAVIWPIVATLLLAPQRRAHDPDHTRPL
ncbi:MAG: rod shape-determining protein MreD [Burkholderiaceae bacterium]|nr:rod shape-determining protein MreD [Burkholderiaceae bacterium]